MSDSGRVSGSARENEISSAENGKNLAALIEQIARERDKQAFVALFEHFAPRLKGYLMRLGSDEAQAEEISQEVMLTVWRKAHMFDVRRAMPSTWIFTIARNRRIDRLRRQTFSEVDLLDPVLIAEEPEMPDAHIEAEQRQDFVRKAITKLPQQQAELVYMAFFNDWSHSKIADKLELPLGTVKSRLRLAFGRLREALRDPLGQED